MILVDTSVWIDHLRAGDPELGDLLRDGQMLAQRLWTRDKRLAVVAAQHGLARVDASES